jgi:hypothetical protein
MIQNRPRQLVTLGTADRTRSGAERHARTTAIALVAAAQNGTSGALAIRKHARHQAVWATPRTGSDRGQVVSSSARSVSGV